MIGDRAEFERVKTQISASTSRHFLHTHATINLLGKWVKDESDLPPANSNTVFLPSFEITIRYIVSRKGMYKDKPFCLSSYLFYGRRHLVSGWDELVKASTEDSDTGRALSFIVKYSNICPDLFLLAYNNPGVAIPVSFDTFKYVDEVTGGKWKTEPCFVTKGQIDDWFAYRAIYDVNKLENDAARKRKEYAADKKRKEDLKNERK